MPSIMSYNSIPRKHTTVRIIIAILLVLAIVIGSFIGGYFYNNSKVVRAGADASNEARKFVSLITDGELDDAYSRSSQVLKSQQSLEEFKGVLSGLKSDSPETQMELATTNPGNTVAMNYMTVIDNLPKTESGRTDGVFNVSLAKESNTWKVTDVSVE